MHKITFDCETLEEVHAPLSEEELQLNEKSFQIHAEHRSKQEDKAAALEYLKEKSKEDPALAAVVKLLS